MDLNQQYPRTSSFNQLKNCSNINSLILSRHTYCLMNLKNCAMVMTLSSSIFFLLYDYHQTVEISFIWRALLRRQIDAFKNCASGGDGVLRTMLRGVPFSGFKRSLASISYWKDSAFTTVKGMQRLLGVWKAYHFPVGGKFSVKNGI